MSKDLLRRVGEILHGYSMLSTADHVGVAVSGGADSVVLLRILHSLLRDTGQKLTIVHVNHQLRGAESDADEEFVRKLASSLGLPLLTRKSPVAAGNVEQGARHGRQSFFRLCREQHGITRIALGHTQSDQAETILFRVLRGTGLTGLAGMSPVTRSGLIRPLLFISREEIRDFARAARWDWREDATNGDLRFRRNRLRLMTMPKLREDYNLSLDKVLARAATIAQSEESYWDRHITRLYRSFITQIPIGLTASCQQLATLHPAQQRRLLRRSVSVVRKDQRPIDAFHIEGILRICASEHGHDRLMVPGVDAIRSFDTLLLTPPETMRQARGYELEVILATPVQLPFYAGRLIVNRAIGEEQNYANVKNTGGFLREQAYFDGEVVQKLSPDETLRVRNWQPGDQFQRLESSRSEKIKTLFQEKKVVLWERRNWPVLTVGGEVVWVRGFGTSNKFCPGLASQHLLHLQFEPAFGSAIVQVNRKT